MPDSINIDSPRGRPRSDRAHRAILQAAMDEMARVGFRSLTIDSIATRAGVAKTTIYRRWPHKAAVVMDAFLTLVGPGTEFPQAPRAILRIQRQMRLQVKFFQSPHGTMIRELLAEAQHDSELAEAFRERWIEPRRRMTKEVLEETIAQGELPAGIDFELAVDLLYAPIYYRFQIGTGPLDTAFTDALLVSVLAALRGTSQTL